MKQEALHVLEDMLRGKPAQSKSFIAPDREVTLTYGELRGCIAALEERLARLGVGAKDRVAVVMPNSPEMAALFFAVAGLGATFAPLNPAYTLEEFRFYLEDIGPKVLVTAEAQESIAPKALPAGALWVELAPLGNRFPALHAHGQIGQRDNPTKSANRRSPAPEDVALFLHTSGTTSRPKGVPLAHANLLASARNIASWYRLSPEDVGFCVMPLFHVHGLLTPVLSTMLSGGTVIVPPRFSASHFWPTVEHYRATWYSAVPTIHQVLLMRAEQDQAPKKSTLKFARSSSMALAPSLMEGLEARFGLAVLEGYGMTEASHQIASNPLPPKERRPGSVGLPTGLELAILGEDKAFLGPEISGEVVLKGPSITKGYVNNPKANEEAFFEGWFRTGDLGVVSGDGYVTLLGRLKELINRGGEKIAPIEVDNALLSHPKVAEAVVFGIPDPKYGEEVACAVVLKEPVSEAELKRFLMERLSAFKVPKVIRFVDALPRSGSGKVSRKAAAMAFKNP